MKNILIMLVLSVFFSCNGENDYRIDKPGSTIKAVRGNLDIIVFEIDSCEYVVANTRAGTSIIHKQNCKFCIARDLQSWSEVNGGYYNPTITVDQYGKIIETK